MTKPLLRLVDTGGSTRRWLEQAGASPKAMEQPTPQFAFAKQV